MRIISRRTLLEFWSDRRYRDAEQPLRAWFTEVKRATWRTPADVKAAHRNASFLANSRVVFNIAGNKYRLVVAVKYTAQIVFVRFVGTHEQYDPSMQRRSRRERAQAHPDRGPAPGRAEGDRAAVGRARALA